MLTDFALEDVPVGFKGSVSLSGCESSIVNGPLSVPSGLYQLVFSLFTILLVMGQGRISCQTMVT